MRSVATPTLGNVWIRPDFQAAVFDVHLRLFLVATTAIHRGHAFAMRFRGLRIQGFDTDPLVAFSAFETRVDGIGQGFMRGPRKGPSLLAVVAIASGCRRFVLGETGGCGSQPRRREAQ